MIFNLVKQTWVISISNQNISLSPESTVNLALRTQNTVMARLQVPALTGNRIDTIHFKDKEMIPSVDQVSLGEPSSNSSTKSQK